MSLGATAPGAGVEEVEGDIHSLAVYPLATPAIAGPGAMLTVVLLTDNRVFGFWEQVLTTAALAAVLAAFLVVLLAANPIMRVDRGRRRQRPAACQGDAVERHRHQDGAECIPGVARSTALVGALSRPRLADAVPAGQFPHLIWVKACPVGAP
jgi:hypothetical protein